MREGADNIFTDSSAAAISMSIFAFLCLAVSALISGYKLSTQPYIWSLNFAKLSYYSFILLYKSLFFCILMRKGVRPHLSGSVHMLYSEIWYWFHIRIHVMFSHVSCTWDCLLTNVTKKRWCGECIIWIWLWDASNGSQKTRNWISFFVSLQSDYLMYIQKEFWLVKILEGSTFNL